VVHVRQPLIGGSCRAIVGELHVGQLLMNGS